MPKGSNKKAIRRRRAGRKRLAKLIRRQPNGQPHRPPQEPVLPTPERAAKGAIEVEETMAAGVRRARVKYECLLDVLYDSGDLGVGPTGARRYNAGLWLRRLYLATHAENVVCRFDSLGRGHSEMSDELAAAHTQYRRAMIEMGPQFGVLRQVCCNDRPGRVSLLQRGLDQLADWRGLDG